MCCAELVFSCTDGSGNWFRERLGEGSWVRTSKTQLLTNFYCIIRSPFNLPYLFPIPTTPMSAHLFTQSLIHDPSCCSSVGVSSVSIMELCDVMFSKIISSYLQDGWSSLMLACENGHTEVVRMLLSAGAHVNHQSKVSSTSPAQ